MNAFTVDDSISRGRCEDRAARGWAVARKCLLGLSLTLACHCALGQAMYRIKPLGYLGGCTTNVPTVVGLNGKDEVAGNACNANGDQHAFKWRNDGHPMVDLGPVGYYSEATALNASGLVTGFAQDGTSQYAFVSSGDGTPMKRIDGLGSSGITALAINDLGQLTGYAETGGGTHAFLWKNDGSPMLDLGTLGGSSYGYAINASGQVAGLSHTGNGAAHSFIWKNDGTPMFDLGTLGGTFSSACCINASGQVAGSSYIASYGRTHAYFWRNDGTPMQDLSTGGPWSGSSPNALNDSGQIAGYYSFTIVGLNTRKVPHAFAWMNDGTAMKDLGTFGGTLSAANDINSSGQVTGYANLSGDTASRAFLWRNDGTKKLDLNKLIDPTDPLKPYVTLTSGLFINDSGDVLATGTDSRTGVRNAPYLLQGTVLTLSSRSLSFGNHPINTTSAAKSVTVTNTSAKVVAITSIVLKGSNPGQFASTNDCGSSLVGHATCTIQVTFKSTTKGAKSATLNVNGGGGGLRTVTLTGTGT